MLPTGPWKGDIREELIEAWHDGNVFGAMTGLLAFLATAFLLAIFWPLSAYKITKDWWKHDRPRGPYDILYCRFDWAQQRQLVGGSVTHSRGLIKAFRMLGKNVLTVSSIEIDGTNNHVGLPHVNGFGLIGYVWNMLCSVIVIPCAALFQPLAVYQRYTWTGLAGVLAAKLVGAQHILEWNGSDVWMNANWNKVKRWPLPIKIGERLMLRMTDRIVCVSSGLKDQLVQMYSIDPLKIDVVENGYDPEKFNDYNVPPYSRFRMDVPRDAFIVGWVGTFGPWHGTDILAEAIRKDHSDIVWLVIGKGLLAEGFLQKVSMNRNLKYIPEVEHDMVGRYLRTCNVLLNLSTDNRDYSKFFGSPTKLFEYLASGVPVITTAVGQPDILLEHGKNCIKIGQDAEELLNAIYYLRSNPDVCKQISEGAKMRSKDYTWRRAAERILIANQLL